MSTEGAIPNSKKEELDPEIQAITNLQEFKTYISKKYSEDLKVGPKMIRETSRMIAGWGGCRKETFDTFDLPGAMVSLGGSRELGEKFQELLIKNK
ncbi:MAG: hypothetical protein AAB895_02560 [Patescibacteria group bacterium]